MSAPTSPDTNDYRVPKPVAYTAVAALIVAAGVAAWERWAERSIQGSELSRVVAKMDEQHREVLKRHGERLAAIEAERKDDSKVLSKLEERAAWLVRALGGNPDAP